MPRVRMFGSRVRANCWPVRQDARPGESRTFFEDGGWAIDDLARFFYQSDDLAFAVKHYLDDMPADEWIGGCTLHRDIAVTPEEFEVIKPGIYDDVVVPITSSIPACRWNGTAENIADPTLGNYLMSVNFYLLHSGYETPGTDSGVPEGYVSPSVRFVYSLLYGDSSLLVETLPYSSLHDTMTANPGATIQDIEVIVDGHTLLARAVTTGGILGVGGLAEITINRVNSYQYRNAEGLDPVYATDFTQLRDPRDDEF